MLPESSNPVVIPNAATSEWLLVSPELAHRWRQESAFPRQRTRISQHVDMLVGLIQRGEFEPDTIVFYHTPKGVYLTDGQHRLDAISLAGRDVWLNVVRKYGSYHEAELAYARTDRGRQRSLGDCQRALALPEALGLTATQARHLLTAMVPILAGFESPARYPDTRSFDARAAIAADWGETARAAFGLYEGAGDAQRGWVRRLLAGVPFAVALVTLRHAPRLAELFWGAIAAQEGLVRYHPEHTLMRWIQDNPQPAGGNGPRYARALAAAWNARVEGRECKQIRIGDPALAKPILLRGTPYDGKHLQLPRPPLVALEGGQ